LIGGCVFSRGNTGNTTVGHEVGGDIVIDSGAVVRRTDGGPGPYARGGNILLRTGNVYNVSSEAAVNPYPADYTTRLFISGDNGNVGIGTGSPQSLLHVNGNLMCSPSAGAPVSYLRTCATSYGSYWNYYGVSIGTTWWDGSNWNIPSDGINRGGANIMFNFAGDINFTTGFYWGASGTLTDAQMAAQNRMTITGAGYVNINGPVGVNGTANTYFALTVNGSGNGATDTMALRNPNADTNFIVTFYNKAGEIRGIIRGQGANAISYDTTSDRRKKTNVEPIRSGLEIVHQLRPVHFQWKDDGLYDYGFIAQEVYKVLPHLRPNLSTYIKSCTCTPSLLNKGILCEHCQSMNDEPVTDEGEPKYYSLDYGKFTPYLMAAIQEQQQIIQSQEQIIQTQQQTISSLSDRLSRVESILSQLVR
jgi:hypothetical protein